MHEQHSAYRCTLVMPGMGEEDPIQLNPLLLERMYGKADRRVLMRNGMVYNAGEGELVGEVGTEKHKGTRMKRRVLRPPPFTVTVPTSTGNCYHGVFGRTSVELLPRYSEQQRTQRPYVQPAIVVCLQHKAHFLKLTQSESEAMQRFDARIPCETLRNIRPHHIAVSPAL